MNLPPELIDVICFHLGGDEEYITLNTCALVSSSWNSTSRRYSSFRDLLVTHDNHAALLALLTHPLATCNDTRVFLRSVQFDNEDRKYSELNSDMDWVFTSIHQISQSYSSQRTIQALSFHHFPWDTPTFNYEYLCAHLVPSHLPILAPHTLIFDDCDFLSISTLSHFLSHWFSLTTISGSPAIHHLSINYPGFEEIHETETKKLTPPFKELTTTIYNTEFILSLITNSDLASSLTHLTILSPIHTSPDILTHVPGLQSLVLWLSSSIRGLRIDLTRHASFRHLCLFVSHAHPIGDDSASLKIITEFLGSCDFPPSFSSLTLNIPANKFRNPTCWSASSPSSFLASKRISGSLSELSVNLIKEHVYRVIEADSRLADDAVALFSISPDDLEVVMNTWEAKTREEFEEFERRGVLKLGIYKPTLEDRLHTLYAEL
ncbi:hypothetical protein AX16_006658 [Volvariella volvacea WC 439]|nr:hypothetical protein AX16_006658 [Volvariella volvacea WC 439]